jgi:hypothetical protein
VLARALVCVLIVSCASSDATSPGVQRSRLQACTALASATCARLEACAPAFARVSVGGRCITTLTEHCFDTAGLYGSTRDPSQCHPEQLSCGELLANYPNACAAPKGLLANGVMCAFDEQCAFGACNRPTDSACGTCASAPSLAGPGEVCGPTRACQRLLFCNVDRCAVRKKAGEACGGVGQCDPFDTLVCNETYKCEAAKVAKLGEACTFTANALVLCEAPYRCIEGKCASAKPEGAACGVNGAHECEGFDADCLGGRCVRRRVEMCAQK